MYLDFNGTRIQELLEIDGTKLSKVRHFDVSHHHETMKRQGKLESWVDNVHGLSRIVAPEKWHVKAVMAMRHIDGWHEKVGFYAEHVFPVTGKPLTIVLDDCDNTVHSVPVVKLINSIIKRYPDEIFQKQFVPRSVGTLTTNQRFHDASDLE